MPSVSSSWIAGVRRDRRLAVDNLVDCLDGATHPTREVGLAHVTSWSASVRISPGGWTQSGCHVRGSAAMVVNDLRDHDVSNQRLVDPTVIQKRDRLVVWLEDKAVSAP